MYFGATMAFAADRMWVNRTCVRARFGEYARRLFILRKLVEFRPFFGVKLITSDPTSKNVLGSWKRKMIDWVELGIMLAYKRKREERDWQQQQSKEYQNVSHNGTEAKAKSSMSTLLALTTVSDENKRSLLHLVFANRAKGIRSKSEREQLFVWNLNLSSSLTFIYIYTKIRKTKRKQKNCCEKWDSHQRKFDA